MQHYNDAIYVVLEISLPGETHPHRHVQYQVTINREWNNNKLMEYFQNVWLHRRSTYNPLRTDSSVTQAWIFENYQATIDKISSLQVFLFHVFLSIRFYMTEITNFISFLVLLHFENP